MFIFDGGDLSKRPSSDWLCVEITKDLKKRWGVTIYGRSNNLELASPVRPAGDPGNVLKLNGYAKWLLEMKRPDSEDIGEYRTKVIAIFFLQFYTLKLKLEIGPKT